MDEQPIHKSTDKARAGTTPHIVRYVLAISMLLAVIAMALVIGLR